MARVSAEILNESFYYTIKGLSENLALARQHVRQTSFGPSFKSYFTGLSTQNGGLFRALSRYVFELFGLLPSQREALDRIDGNNCQ